VEGGELLHDLAGDRGGHLDLAGVDAFDAMDQIFAAGVLQQVAAGAGADPFEDVVVLVVHGEEDDLDLRILLLDLACGDDPAHLGHADIHQDDVGLQLADEAHGLRAVVAGADELDLRLQADEANQAVPHELVIIDDEQANHRW